MRVWTALLVFSLGGLVRAESFTRSYVVGSAVTTIGSGEFMEPSRGNVKFTFWEKIISPGSEPLFSCGIKSDFQGNFTLRFDRANISETILVTLRRNASTPVDGPLRAFFDLDQIENLRPSQVVVSVLNEGSDSLGFELGKIEIISRTECRMRRQVGIHQAPRNLKSIRPSKDRNEKTDIKQKSFGPVSEVGKWFVVKKTKFEGNDKKPTDLEKKNRKGGSTKKRMARKGGKKGEKRLHQGKKEKGKRQATSRKSSNMASMLRERQLLKAKLAAIRQKLNSDKIKSRAALRSSFSKPKFHSAKQMKGRKRKQGKKF